MQWRGFSGNHCTDCTSLSNFLAAGNQKTARFCVLTQRRNHMEKALRGSACSITTDRSSTPYTLVVEKTEEDWKRRLRDWEQTRRSIEQHIATLDHQKLGVMLADQYRPILQSYAVDLPDLNITLEREPLKSLAQVVPPSKPDIPTTVSDMSGGLKRDVEVIDLEDVC